MKLKAGTNKFGSAIVLVLALTFAACGGSGGGSPEPVDPNPPPPPPSTGNVNISNPTLVVADNTPVTGSANMTLVFSDEFNADKLDPEVWYFETGDGSQRAATRRRSCLYGILAESIRS